MPQSEKFGCCGTFGQHPFIVSLLNTRVGGLPIRAIWALYSHSRYPLSVATTLARLPECNESNIKMQGLQTYEDIREKSN